MFQFNMDNDDIFEGSPIDKWLEIVFHSHRSLAEAELRRILENLALCEMLLDEVEPDWERKITKLKHALDEKTQSRVANLAIESMGNILTQSE